MTRGTASSRGGAPAKSNQDTALYVHLMGTLKKKSLLPVVVFTLSKKRCESNAATLANLDLCTSTEKSEVHVAIGKALGRLGGACILSSVLFYMHLGLIALNWLQSVIRPPPLHVIGGLGFILTR